MQASLSWSFTAGQDLKTVVEILLGFLLTEKLSAKSPSTPLCSAAFNGDSKNFICSSVYGQRAEGTGTAR